MLALLVLQLSLVSCIQALGIFIPLDVDPAPGTCSGWTRVISSISANPQTSFFSIVNPNDGPGDHGSQPSDAFRHCVQLLRPRFNATVLGYINTETGSKALSNVQNEIDTYAGWNPSYRPTGIFFDAVPSRVSLVSQYKSYATYARGKGFEFIGLDPGEMPDPGYFSIADLVNVYESSYASFHADENVFNDTSTPTHKQSVWLTEAPVAESYGAVISQIAEKGVAAVYISNFRDDEAGIPTQWASFVEDVGRENAETQPPQTRRLFTHPSLAYQALEYRIHKFSHEHRLKSNPIQVSSSPQATGKSSQQTSSHPPVGAIVGGTLGGLVTLSVVLLIIFFIRRNRRRQDHSVAGEVVHPFTASQPTLLGNNHHVAREKRRFANVLGNFHVGASSRRENNNTSAASQTTPSSSAMAGLPDSQTDLSMRAYTLSTNGVSIGPPPTYST